jgi:hypothetical protein
MISRSVSQTLDHERKQVYPFLSDFSKMQQHWTAVTRAELNGPLAVGTTGVYEWTFMDREIANDIVITVVSENWEIGFESTSGPVSFRRTHSVSDERLSQGRDTYYGSEVTFSIDLTFEEEFLGPGPIFILRMMMENRASGRLLNLLGQQIAEMQLALPPGPPIKVRV